MDGSLGKLGKKKKFYMMKEYLKRGYTQFKIVNHPVCTSAGVNHKVISMMSYLYVPLQLP